MANYTKINLDLQSDLVLSNAKIDAVTGGLRSELDGILSSASAEETRALAAEGVLASDISAEETRAIAAEGVLSSDILTEKNRALAAELVLTNDLAAEVSRAVEAELNLDSAIISEINRAEAAELVLTNELADEKARAIAEEGVLAGKISDEENRATAAEGVLDGKIGTEKGRIDAILSASSADKDTFAEIVTLINSVDLENDNALASTLLAEQNARISGDATNATAIDAEVVRAKAAELVNANNIVSGDAATLASGKTYADAKVATEKTERIADVNAEKTRAEGAEDSLGMDIANETERAIAAESGLQSSINTLTVDAQDYADAAVLVEKNRAEGVEATLESSIINNYEDLSQVISNEETRALGVEGALAADILAEKNRAVAEEGIIAGKLSDEISRAEGVEAGLQSSIDNLVTDSQTYTDNAVAGEKADRVAADDVLSFNLDAEVSRAMAAEIGLGNDLAAEVTRATAKESILSGEILTEKNRAIAAEGVLDGKIGTEKGRIDAILSASSADKDSFAEIVTLINSVDTANDTAFAGYVLDNNAALATEKADRIEGDSDLNNKIGEEASRATAAELVLTNGLAEEKARAIAEEGVLAGKISDEISRAEAAELVLTNNLATEVSNRISGDADTLADAKAYADGIAGNYDAAGSAAQALLDAEAKDVVRAAEANAYADQAELDAIASANSYTDGEVSGLRNDVDTAMEAMGAIDFSTIFAQKIGGKTSDNVIYTLSLLDLSDVLPVMGTSLQVFENGLLLEAGVDYDVISTGGVNDAQAVKFKYEIKSDWKVAFFGVPFKASVSDLVA